MPSSQSLAYFFDHSPESLAQWCREQGLATFRAKQVMDWVYHKNVNDPQHMTNLSQKDRDLFQHRMVFSLGHVLQHQQATDGTQKLLIQWPTDDSANGANVGVTLPLAQPQVVPNTSRQTECVMIPELDGGKRRTACISSQVGCPVGCKFCASGLGGLDANLTVGQIVEQVWQLSQLPRVDRISNVVFMGMGEPLSNFAAVTAAVKTLTADWGLGISGRKITISTVGLPAQIKRLAEQQLPVTLAISLHAPNDEIRRKIIPWAEFVSIDQIIDAGRFYFNQTGREVTLEYILLGQVNDQPEHARELAQVARTIRSNVNLIRYNEVRSLPFQRPAGADVHTFQKILADAGVNTHIRASRGRDIAAACGQLRHENK